MSDFIDEYYKEKDLSLLKKLTLIIPSHNRNYYLSRCLWYHAHFPFGQIIVADSSTDEKKTVNRETVAKVKEKFGRDILYLEYKPETSELGGDIYRKWGDAVQHVETEYSQICTDKEFVIPTTVLKCISYLDSHDDYIASGSRKYSICLKGKRDISMDMNDYHLLQRKPNRESEIGDTIFQRYQSAFLNAHGWSKNLLLTIHRSDVQKYVFELLDKYSIDDIRYGELVCAYAGYLFGKFYYLDSEIYKIRDIIMFQKSGGLQPLKKSVESSNSSYPFLSDYFSEGNSYDILYENFKRCATTEISQFSNQSLSFVKDLVEKYITKQFLLQYDSGKSTAVTKLMNRFKFLKYLWEMMPLNMKKVVATIYQKTYGYKIDLSYYIPCNYSGEIEILSRIITKTISNNETDLLFPMDSAHTL